MTDYAKVKISQLRQELSEMGIDPSEIKGKSALVDLHKNAISNAMTEILDNDSSNLEEKDDVPTGLPEYGSVEWCKWVMDQFHVSELDDSGNPRIHGLRRVAHRVLGPILTSGPIETFPSSDPDGPGRATVVVEINIMFQNENDIRTFRAVGSSWHGNTDDEFAIYPEAMAETRAEARALRRALGLSQVSADEVTTKDAKEVIEQYKNKQDTEGTWDTNEGITDVQKNSIQLMCTRLNIDLIKFINSGKYTYEDLDDVKKVFAAKMLAKLNQYQTGQIEIPEELKNED